MEQKNIQIRIWIAWVLVGGWMGVIFYLSHQPAGQSSALSTGVLQTVLSFIEMIFSMELTQSEMLHFIIRKGAHVFAYFVLAILVFLACRTTGWEKRASIGSTFVICLGYAISDEVHQLFIDGRSGQVTDVLIDMIGVCIGIGLYMGYEKLLKRVSTER